MSHNDPNLETQVARHRFPIVAIAVLVLVVLAGLLWWLNREVSESTAVPPEQAETVAPQDPATTGPGALSEPPSEPVAAPTATLEPAPTPPTN